MEKKATYKASYVKMLKSQTESYKRLWHEAKVETARVRRAYHELEERNHLLERMLRVLERSLDKERHHGNEAPKD